MAKNKVQQGWIHALSCQIAASDENDMISMAEHIVCDTERLRVRRNNRQRLNLFERASSTGS